MEIAVYILLSKQKTSHLAELYLSKIHRKSQTSIDLHHHYWLLWQSVDHLVLDQVVLHAKPLPTDFTAKGILFCFLSGFLYLGWFSVVFLYLESCTRVGLDMFIEKVLSSEALGAKIALESGIGVVVSLVMQLQVAGLTELLFTDGTGNEFY